MAVMLHFLVWIKINRECRDWRIFVFETYLSLRKIWARTGTSFEWKWRHCIIRGQKSDLLENRSPFSIGKKQCLEEESVSMCVKVHRSKKICITCNIATTRSRNSVKSHFKKQNKILRLKWTSVRLTAGSQNRKKYTIESIDGCQF